MRFYHRFIKIYIYIYMKKYKKEDGPLYPKGPAIMPDQFLRKIIK